MYPSWMWYDSVASLTTAVQDQLDDMREIDAAIAARPVFEATACIAAMSWTWRSMAARCSATMSIFARDWFANAAD